MGVAGTAGVLAKQGHNFSESRHLCNTKLVVDVTESMYWFVKRHYAARAERPDLFGSSMIALSCFYRNFFKRLRERNVSPIIVYSGGRLSEANYGPVASKSVHLKRSSQIALNNISRSRFSHLESMPLLAQNALKEVINEFQFEHVHQSTHEVYPLLERLAREHNCPVISSHSDFIFMPISQEFIWFDSLQLPTDERDPIVARFYSHKKMLAHFGRQNESPALRALYTLLRDDFSETYYQTINELLNLRGHLALSPYRRPVKTQRLLYILQTWPKKLSSLEMVRMELNKMLNRNNGFDRDFNAIQESFCYDKDLGRSKLAKDFVLPNVNDFDQACTRRESVATFMMELRQPSTYNRCQVVEDLRTIRSTYSVGDRLKQYLLNQLAVNRLQINDRRKTIYELRELKAMPLIDLPANADPDAREAQRSPRQMDCACLYQLFHFDLSILNEISVKVREQLQVQDLEHSRRLALLLLLARFGYKLAFRQTYDNHDDAAANKKPKSPGNTQQQTQQQPQQQQQQQATSTTGSDRSESQGSDADQATSNSEVNRIYKAKEMRRSFYSAIVNSYVFHIDYKQGDTNRQEIPAEVRLACDNLRNLQNESLAGLGSPKYFEVKHLIEMLNVVLQNYKELNSLYGYVSPNFLVNRHYDGILIYRIMYRWSKNLSDFLLRVEDELLEQLN